MAINKTYQYKIWGADGTYLGLLQNVTSDFNYNQTMASVGTQVTISVALSADTASQPVQAITDETGAALLTEIGTGEILTTERQPDAVGSGNQLAQISNNNTIQIWEFSGYHTNGILKFSGYISKWNANFGTTDDVTVTCLSNGQDLSQFLVQSGNTPHISQTTDNGTTEPLVPGGAKGLDYRGEFQNFTPVDTFSCGGVSVEIQTPEAGTMDISMYAGTLHNGDILSIGSPLASGTVHLGAVSKSVQTVTFNVPTTLTSGTPYWFWVNWGNDSGSDSTAYLYANSTNPYAPGDSGQTGTSGTYDLVIGMNNADLYFVISAHGTGTTATYTSQDPSFMLTDIMNIYKQKGGDVSIPYVPILPLVQAVNNDSAIPLAYWGDGIAQIFTPSKNMTINLLQACLGVSSGSYTMNLSIAQGDPTLDTAQVIGGGYTWTFGGSNHIIATSNNLTFSNASPAVQTFAFTTPVNLVAGTEYYIFHSWNQAEFGNLLFQGASNTDVTADTQVGKLYGSYATFNNASFNPAYDSSHPNIYFTLSYVNPIPTNLLGGYANTGVSATYTFKVQTMLQAIQAVATLAPANWYWYVDPASNILYFSSANTTADIQVVRGRHINTLDIEATKENIINNVYFTGGDDGTGVNIFVQEQAALGTNRVGLGQLNDNRVSFNGQASKAAAIVVAQTIADAFLSDNSSETYQTNITIQDTTMDINLFNLGMVVGFAGFGTFVDNLLLQIVGINYTPDQVTLQLGNLPVRTSAAIEQINSQLGYEQTLDNPTSPS